MAESALPELILVSTYLTILVVTVVSMWKIFTKANQPGWAAIVPIYNVYVTLKVADDPWWYLLLLLVPVVNIFVIVKIWIDVADAFGHGIAWGLGLAFLGVVFLPILAFGGSTYQGSGQGGGPGGDAGATA